MIQANKFGAVLSVGTPVTGVTFNGGYSQIGLDDGESIVAKSLLVATGADYRRLEVDGCERFEGCGVYYSATPNEAKQCTGADAAVVGGGNSAGQAAVYLAGQARTVYLLIRGGDLYKQMSSYLAHRIEHTPNIEILLNTTVEHMLGDGQLKTIEVVDRQDGREARIEHRRALQLHRRRTANRMAAQRHRDRRSRLRPDRVSRGEVVGWAHAARAVPPRDQPARRVRRG